MRKFVLLSGVTSVVLGGALFGLGTFMNTDMSTSGPNIGAGVMSLFGIFVGLVGVFLVLTWAAIMLIGFIMRRSPRIHNGMTQTTGSNG